ncbi:MAG: thiamine ABC transporter substrate-binding protein [Actinobacteria bacterium]|nr:thiamine ABC transporter substrate-binding protein [Actinomycetota bacterium]
MVSSQRALAVLAAAFAFAGTGCGGGSSPSEVVLVTHDSFVVSDEVKSDFERESGLTLRILQSGDAGEAVTKALLTAGNPQGDVLFGVDNNLLSRALDGELFESYEPRALETVDPRYLLDSEHRVTPIDHGEVCLNYDKAWFAERDIDPPTSLEALVRPDYENLLVVENPATSTPGLAFMLATLARFGEGDAWERYWRALRENGVLVVDGWEEAYNIRFSGSAGKGDRPLVVSYASSPPAEVIFGDPQPLEAPTGVVETSCFLQIEFAGILRGARNESGARELVDFLLSRRFQEDVPLSMFVFPVNASAVLPEVFSKHAVVPRDPLELPPEMIEANRERWVDEWTRIVLR